MSRPLISVIIPVYNGEKYLQEAIESVLNQAYTDFELIIINDGSTDSTESIILKYPDSRIRYISQENSGVGAALRNGCNLANGIYIARMDADDICFPQRFKLQKEYLDNHPSAVLVSSAVIYINESGRITGRSFPYTSNLAIRKKLKTMNPICHPGVMMRTDAYKKSVGYLNIQPFEDHILWLSLSKLGKINNFRFPLLQYRILNESVSRTISRDQHKKLFDFLGEKMYKGYLNDDEITEYNQYYEQEKTMAISLSGEEKSNNNEMNEDYSTSKNQFRLYHIFKKLRIPEPYIEFFICTFKNTFLLFK